jgi:hypothetical protein
VPALLHVKNGIMADFTIVIVFAQMKFMAENYRISVFKGESDILCFGCSGANRAEHYNRIGKQYKVFLHGFHSSGT